MIVEIINSNENVTFFDLKAGDAFMRMDTSDSSVYLKTSSDQGLCLKQKGSGLAIGSVSKFAPHAFVIPSTSVKITVTF